MTTNHQLYELHIRHAGSDCTNEELADFVHLDETPYVTHTGIAHVLKIGERVYLDTNAVNLLCNGASWLRPAVTLGRRRFFSISNPDLCESVDNHTHYEARSERELAVRLRNIKIWETVRAL